MTSPSLLTGPVRSMISSFDSAVGGRRGVMRSVGCRPLVSEIELKGAKILVPRRLRRRTVQGLVQVAHLPAEFPPENLGFLILAIWRHPILARHDALRGTHTDARRTGRKVGTPKSSKNFERERRVRAGFSVTEKFHPSLSSRPRDRSPPENWTQRTRFADKDFVLFRDPSSGTLTSAEAHRPSQADPTLSDRSRVFQPALRSTPGAPRARPEPFSLG